MKTVKQVKNEIITGLQHADSNSIDCDNVAQMFSAVAFCDTCGIDIFPADKEEMDEIATKQGYDITKMFPGGDVFGVLNNQ